MEATTKGCDYVKPKKDVTLSPTISWINAEIEIALQKYFSLPNALSYTVYWPRALRDLLQLIVKKVVGDESLLAEFNMKDPKILELLLHLQDELAKPTSHYISIPLRKLSCTLLHQIQLLNRGVFKLARPKPLEDVVDAAWPNDINDFEDLNESLSSFRLRRDVKLYLIDLLNKVMKDEPFKLNFVGFMREAFPIKQYPIQIEVSPFRLQDVRGYLSNESTRLADCGSLVPDEVVEVVSLEDIVGRTTVSN